MKVALVVYACVWPILFNTIYGMRSVDPVAADTARVFGLGRVKTSARVHLRSASPFIFTGIKIAAGDRRHPGRQRRDARRRHRGHRHPHARAGGGR